MVGVGEYRRAEPAGAQGSGTLVRVGADVEADVRRSVRGGEIQPGTWDQFTTTTGSAAPGNHISEISAAPASDAPQRLNEKK